MTFLRSLLFNIVFYLNTLVLMVLFSPVLFLPRRWGFGAVRTWVRTSLWWLRVLAGVRLEVRGKELLPEGGFILAAKHQSAFETFALLTLVDDFTYILKRELMWMPFFGWYLQKFEMIPVNRGKGRKAIEDFMPKARAAFAKGRTLLIFPEGTRTRPGSAPKYKIGVGHIYVQSGVPCVPVALNAGLYWPRQGFMRYPGTIVVEILPPIEPGLTLTDFMTRLEHDIEVASDRLIVEASERDNRPLPQTFQPV